ncbi:MAG TPA: outer membrane protein transport protein [Candidatus Limnocylindria bacterium]|nr:outer membrane protein transport protein [Candidatus Limnocylindria bacterium]
MPTFPWNRVARTTTPTLLTLASILATHAEGFRNPAAGAASLGQAGGRRVFSDDASAAFEQPSNLVGLDQWEVSLEPVFLLQTVRYTSPSGATEDTKDTARILPSLFVGGPIGNGKFAAGLAVTEPYGFLAQWPNENPATEPLRDQGPVVGGNRLTPYHSDLRSVNVGPTVGMEVLPGLQVAVGFDAMWSTFEVRDHLSAPGPGILNTDFGGKGDGVGFGGNASVTWEFIPGQRLAATIRSPMDIEYKGDSHLQYPAGLGSLDFNSSFSTKIRFPTIVGLGYGVELPNNIRLEANVEWLEYSRFKELSVAAPFPGTGVATPLSTPEDWRDTFTAGVGGSWRFSEHWTLRSSYLFAQTPVPNSTLSPLFPDADQHLITVGVGGRYGRHRLDLAYGHAFYATARPSGSYVGRFELDSNLFSAAYGFGF